MKTCIRKIDLDNSLIVLIYDTTRCYYEDYHLVRLEIECEVPIKDEYFDSSDQRVEARKAFGASVFYRRTVEKMGVPYAEIEQARDNLVDSFMSTAIPYFGSHEFPRKLVLTELTKLVEKKRQGIV
ncbi:MAG TPA: hypothetical protein PLI53_08630 [Geobacteraceae bacterium]|nr:hypothetical protein [Geobacteraceae bacterium]